MPAVHIILVVKSLWYAHNALVLRNCRVQFTSSHVIFCQILIQIHEDHYVDPLCACLFYTMLLKRIKSRPEFPKQHIVPKMTIVFTRILIDFAKIELKRIKINEFQLINIVLTNLIGRLTNCIEPFLITFLFAISQWT